MNKMKGYAIVKKSKERKMERKAKHKALSVEKTIKSRQRRLDNKAKRDEIHAINPDAKITIINGITYINGVKVRVIHGQIKSHLNAAPLINEPIIDIFDETVEVFEPEAEEFKKGRAIDNQIEKERLFGFKALANKFRKK